jgi:hypothetical protein
MASPAPARRTRSRGVPPRESARSGEITTSLSRLARGYAGGDATTGRMFGVGANVAFF